MRDIEQDRKRLALLEQGVKSGEPWHLASIGWDDIAWAVSALRDYMAEVERLTAPQPQALGIPGYCIECGLTMEKCWDYGCGHTE